MKKLYLLAAVMLVLAVIAACAPAPTVAPQPTAVPPTATAAPKPPTKLVVWTKEGGTELDTLKASIKDFQGKNPNVTVDLINKGVEDLRNDFQTAALAGTGPDLLWTVNDHIGVFATAKLIAAGEDVFGKDYFNKFVKPGNDAAMFQGKLWGVPISAGNHLMLLYNKKLIKDAPKDTDELIKNGKEFQAANPGKWYLVFNQTEPFWVAPWIGGFGGWPLDDTKTPAVATLGTKASADSLDFLASLRNKEKIMPLEADYDGADGMFKDGKAAMIINGDWSLSSYQTVTATKTIDLGVARIPMVKSTGKWPSPMTSGVYFLIPASTKGDKLDTAKTFVNYFVAKDVQLDVVVKKMNRLPSLTDAGNDPAVTGNAILKGSFEQMSVGRPMPVVPEMRCAWDGWKPNMQEVYAGKLTGEQAAAKAQAAAEDCIKKLK
jgi:arabinogalactan oligomer/maltooligosaccharide transport system substrate-binding protein